MTTNHNRQVEMLHKAAAAFEKLPDNFELLGVTVLGDGENEHIGIHVNAYKPNEDFPELTDIDRLGLRKHAEMAGLKMWFEKNLNGNGKTAFDYWHVLDENGTEMYQGVERRPE